MRVSVRADPVGVHHDRHGDTSASETGLRIGRDRVIEKREEMRADERTDVRHAWHLFAASPGRVKELTDEIIASRTAAGSPDSDRDRRPTGRTSGMNVIGRSSVNDALKQIGARVAVHVAADRQAEEIEDRRHDVDDRRARRLPAARHRRAVRHQEAVRRRFVRAADLGIADHPLEQPLADAERLHAEARHDQQQIVRARAPPSPGRSPRRSARSAARAPGRAAGAPRPSRRRTPTASRSAGSSGRSDRGSGTASASPAAACAAPASRAMPLVDAIGPRRRLVPRVDADAVDGRRRRGAASRRRVLAAPRDASRCSSGG